MVDMNGVTSVLGMDKSEGDRFPFTGSGVSRLDTGKRWLFDLLPVTGNGKQGRKKGHGSFWNQSTFTIE